MKTLFVTFSSSLSSSSTKANQALKHRVKSDAGFPDIEVKMEKLTEVCLTVIHRIRELHFKTDDLLEHKLLDEYEEKLRELNDDLTESMLGLYPELKPGLPTSVVRTELKFKNCLSFFNFWLDSLRKSEIKPELLALVDEIQNLNNQTLYQIRML